MSQNMWNWVDNLPVWIEKGLDCSAQQRMKGHIRVWKELLPDIVGGQEVNAEMQRYLKIYSMEEGLPYTQIWGNYTPLIYRADKLALLDAEYLVYPQEVKGYEGIFNDALSKSCNLGVFQEKESGKIFIFATTHLWWQNGKDPSLNWYRAGSDEVREIQVKLAVEMIDKYQKKYDNCSVVFVGDFNTDYYSKAIQYTLTDACFYHAHDVATEFADEGNGYNKCGSQGPGDKWQHKSFYEAIDHILVRNVPQNSVRRFERYTPDYYLALSDHAPVFMDVVF